MAKIDAIDFGSYVKNTSEYASSILDSKNILNSRGKSLSTKIFMFNRLTPLEGVEKYEEPLFKQLRLEYENDPLLERNGGNYVACMFQVIPSSEGIVTLYKQKCFINTSDGQEITGTTSSNIEINFDSSKDLILEDGTKVRWIKVYYKSSDNYKRTYWSFYYPGDNSSYNRAYFVLWEAPGDIGMMGTGSGEAQPSQLVQIRELVFGHNTTNVVLVSSAPLLYTYSIITPIKYSSYQNESVINWLVSPNTEFTIPFDSDNETLTDADFYQELYNNYEGDGSSYNGVLLKNIKGDVFDLSSNINFKIYNRPLFGSNCNIKKLILNPNAIVSNPAFLNITQISNTTQNVLNEIIFFEGIDIPGLALNTICRLKRTSILDLFNKLRDRTGENSANIILGTYNLYKLSDEDIAIATNKNWTIS